MHMEAAIIRNGITYAVCIEPDMKIFPERLASFGHQPNAPLPNSWDYIVVSVWILDAYGVADSSDPDNCLGRRHGVCHWPDERTEEGAAQKRFALYTVPNEILDEWTERTSSSPDVVEYTDAMKMIDLAHDIDEVIKSYIAGMEVHAGIAMAADALYEVLAEYDPDEDEDDEDDEDGVEEGADLIAIDALTMAANAADRQANDLFNSGKVTEAAFARDRASVLRHKADRYRQPQV